MKYPIKGFLIFCLVFSNLGFSQPTVIKAKAYVDVVSGKLIEPANIVIEDGKISAINPKIQYDCPSFPSLSICGEK